MIYLIDRTLGYENIVSNSVKDPADLSAELVVDARPHGRQAAKFDVMLSLIANSCM